MGTYNRLHASLVCPRCDAWVDAIVDCHFGYTAMMEDLRVGDRYPLPPGDPPSDGGLTMGEGYMECPRCRKDAFLLVRVQGGIVTGVGPDTARRGYIADAEA